MSNFKTLRLNRVLRELNISLDKAIEYLTLHGYEVEARPTTKLSQVEYQVLLDGFQINANKRAAAEFREKKRKDKEALRLELEAKLEKQKEEEAKKEETLRAKAEKIESKPFAEAVGKKVEEKKPVKETHEESKEEAKPESWVIKTQYKKLDGPKILKDKKIDLKQFEKPKIKPKVVGNIENYKPNSYEKLKRRKFYSNQKSSANSLALGSILFFDYRQNDFGFIENVYCNDDYLDKDLINKVYVSGRHVESKKPLYEGQRVAFRLFKGRKGYYAKDVKDLEETNFEEAKELLPLTPVLDKYILIKRLYENFDIEEELNEAIRKELFNLRDIHSWEIVNRYFNEKTVGEYIDKHLDDFNNQEIQDYLNRTFNKRLFFEFLSRYEFLDHFSFVKVLEKIKSKYNFDNVPQSFKNLITTLGKKVTLNNILGYLEIINEKIFFDLAVENFAFENELYNGQLRIILNSEFSTNETITFLRERLFNDAYKLSVDQIIEIYENFGLIDGNSDFIYLIENSSIDKKTFFKLLKQYDHKFSSEQLTSLFEKVKNDLSFADIINMVEEISLSIDLYESVISFLFSVDLSRREFKKLLRLLSSKEPYSNYAMHFAKNHFIKYVNLSDNDLIIFMHRFNNNGINDILPKIRINSEADFFELRELFLENPSISKSINSFRNSNKGFLDFFNFFETLKPALITPYFNKFLTNEIGFLQVNLCKKIVFAYYSNHINKKECVDIFNKISWTEISAILIKSFINLTSTKSKVIVDELNLVFKNHFNILNEKNIDHDEFLRTFTIKDILNQCNCRKTYVGNYWEKGSRWYISGEEPMISDGYIVTYRNNHEPIFCEGRFWKKGDFFNNETKRRVQNGGDLFWCRGSYCAKVNDNCNLEQAYENWTLSEIATVFNLTLDRLVFSTLAGWVNRMNEITERLICRSCNEVLRPMPFTPKSLGYYSVPVFNCINEECSEKNVTIRFTHCLNGKCNNVLDSRDCDSCLPQDPNHIGMRCNECGTPCPKCSGKYNRIRVQY